MPYKGQKEKKKSCSWSATISKDEWVKLELFCSGGFLKYKSSSFSAQEILVTWQLEELQSLNGLETLPVV